MLAVSLLPWLVFQHWICGVGCFEFENVPLGMSLFLSVVCDQNQCVEDVDAVVLVEVGVWVPIWCCGV
jgi:hypothetical protein